MIIHTKYNIGDEVYRLIPQDFQTDLNKICPVCNGKGDNCFVRYKNISCVNGRLQKTHTTYVPKKGTIEYIYVNINADGTNNVEYMIDDTVVTFDQNELFGSKQEALIAATKQNTIGESKDG